MTRRSFFLGLLTVAMVAAFTPYSDLVMRGTWIGLTAFPISSFVVLFVLAAAVNPLLRALRRGLTRGELLSVYSMTLVAAGIPSFGLIGLLAPYMAGPRYFASPENRWSELLLPHLPRWLAPRSAEAIIQLYQASPDGRVPWDQWAGPLAVWAVQIAGVYLCVWGLVALLRRTWVEDEKLVFPLMELPTALAAQDHDSPWPPLLRNPVLWWAFALPFGLHTLNGLHYYVTWLPTLNIHRIDLTPLVMDPPLSAMQPFMARLSFTAIGVAFLLPADLSFSLWVFYFFFMAQQVVGAMMGYPMPNVQAYPVKQFVGHQMFGGIVLFGVYGLWNARRRLGELARCALHDGWRQPAEEALGARWALLCLVTGFALLAGWGAAAGAGAGCTTLLFALFFLVHTVATRLVCEGGMLYVQHPFRPLNLLLAAAGAHRLGAPRIAILGLFDHLWMLDNRSPLMPCLMQSLKVADAGPLKRRSVTLAAVAATITAAVVACVSYLTLMYRHGGMTLNSWFTSYYARNLYATWTAHLIGQGEPAEPLAFLTMGIGAASMTALLILHRNFLWWPLHPIGYLMGASWPMVNFWFPIMLGWLAKSLVLRYGGGAVYRKVVPAFLGLILAEFLSAGLWTAIDMCTGVRGHVIFSF